MRPVISVNIFCITCLWVVTIAGASEQSAARQTKPCVSITGPDSHVRTQRFHRIISDKEWAHIWQEHQGRRPDKENYFRDNLLTWPVIDLDNYMVIVIFLGKSTNCVGLRVVSIAEDNTAIVLRFERDGYQTLGPKGSGAEEGDRTTPYGFYVLPRSSKPVIVEENSQIYKGNPPAWEQRIRFPGLSTTSLGRSSSRNHDIDGGSNEKRQSALPPSPSGQQKWD
jgi:hypothetical protein